MLDGWGSFFAMTGSACATLVGLLFVAVTLSTGLPTSRTLDIARASMTPALYSFGGALLQSVSHPSRKEPNTPLAAIRGHGEPRPLVRSSRS